MDQKTFGRYVIQDRIGKGGMATIFRAEDPMFGREVALKVLPREFLHDPSFRGRFEREARTIATLEHPAIVPVYDFGEDHGQPYLVMRFMRGGSLADRLQKGPMSVKDATHVLQRIGSALDHAHNKGIVHRDLKPGNILFDEYGDPFLADFGIVKIAEATATLTGGGIVGTPAYMSPEQVHGEQEIDGRSDIYALGVILFEMLTGQTPYRADTPAKLMMAHVLNPTPRILESRPDLPPECNAVISKAMAKNRDDRYGTATEMAQVLTGTYPRPPITAASAAAAATVVEPLPPEMAAAPKTGVEPPATYPQTPPPWSATPPPAAAPAESKGRSRILYPVLGGIGFLLCCGILFVAFMQFGGLEQLGLAGDTTTPTVAIAEQGETPLPTDTSAPDVEATVEEVEDEVDDAATAAAAEAESEATRAAATSEAEQESVEEAEATAAAATTAADEAANATAEAEQSQGEMESIAISSVQNLRRSNPVSGPLEGGLAHVEDSLIEAEYMGVSVADFVAEATFAVPYSRLDGSWDVGFLFRDQGVDDQFRLSVDSLGRWHLANQDGSSFELVDEGEVENLNDSVGESNKILLFAEGDTGYLFVNDEFVAQLDLSKRTAAGDLAVAIGIFDDNEREGAETSYREFSLWSDESVVLATATVPPTQAAATSTSAPPPPPPPTTDQTAQLLDSMKSVQSDLQRMGGMIDNAVRTGSVNCRDVVSTYDRIAGAPTYSGLSGEAVSAYSSYRSAITTFTNGARDMRQNCADFLAGGSGSIPFSQWGRARQAVNQALDTLNPAIDRLE